MRQPVDMPIGHPGRGLNPREPVGQARDTTLAVLPDMLLADPANGDVTPRSVGDGDPEEPFGLKDALGMLSGQSNCLFLKTSCCH